MKKTLLLIAGISLVFASCNEAPKEKEGTDMAAEAQTEMEAPEVQQPTIVGVAAGNENFSTLVTAVKAAGLVETLSSTGPFTVFAPTNDAFGKLPEGTVGTLVKPENKAMLTDILTYHVVAGKVMAADVIKAINDNNGTFTTNTVKGEPVSFMLKDGKVMIKDAKGGMSTIIMTDVAASNGVIHAIDTVIMPAE